jgi:hypothetical protein
MKFVSEQKEFAASVATGGKTIRQIKFKDVGACLFVTM